MSSADLTVVCALCVCSPMTLWRFLVYWEVLNLHSRSLESESFFFDVITLRAVCSFLSCTSVLRIIFPDELVSLSVLKAVHTQCRFSMWAQGSSPAPFAPYPFTSPSSTLSFTFTFSLSCLLYLFSYLSIPSLSTRIGPLHFQAGGRRKRTNLGLVFCVDFVLCVFFS